MNPIRIQEIKGKIDFAILTIREDEFEAALQRFQPFQSVIGAKQIYQYCRLKRPDGKEISVAIVRAIDQGQTRAQAAAWLTLSELKPRWLILAGIAGGVPDDDFSLGDVLLANSLLDFSITAAMQDAPVQHRTSGAQMHRRVEALLGTIPAYRNQLNNWNQDAQLSVAKPCIDVPNATGANCYYGKQQFRAAVIKSLIRNFPDSKSTRPPRYKVGALATSNILLKDADLLNQWQIDARHLSHVEMEAAGALSASRNALESEVPLLCVRGLSDIVGFRREPEWTIFACHSAASFVYAILSSLPLELFWDDDANPSASLIPIVTPPSTPTIDDIIDAFKNSSRTLMKRAVDPKEWIPRPEIEELNSFLSDEDASVMCVLGVPGSGKTALLALAAKNAVDAGTATIAVKADLLPSDKPFETWGKRELKTELGALDAIKVVSARSKVLVIVDQLDALSSTVDLTSDRLDDILTFINDCSKLPNVSVICSCRDFDFHHDARFSVIDAKCIDLKLPLWGDVVVQLERHGIKDADNWSPQFRELLQTPQHLQIYLNLFRASGNADTFRSYHLMLDELWGRMIKTPEERDFIYKLTAYLIKNEQLWAPMVLFEGHDATIESLEGKQVLVRDAGRVGFRHQSLLEHAKARHFAKEGESLCAHVLKHQDAILVRPTVWAVLQYLREVHPAQYRKELDDLFSSKLQLHMRYLLIDFLGNIVDPADFEIAILAARLSDDEDRTRILLAIRGKPKWFNALKSSHFPVTMRLPMEKQRAIVAVIAAAWISDRDDCLKLIEDNWLADSDKDVLTWQALRYLDAWDERAIQLVLRLVGRLDPNQSVHHWVQSIVYIISEHQPELAPRVFVEIVRRMKVRSNGENDV